MYDYQNSILHQHLSSKQTIKNHQMHLNSVRLFNNQWRHDHQHINHLPTMRQQNFTEMKIKKKINLQGKVQAVKKNHKKSQARIKYRQEPQQNIAADVTLNSLIFPKKKIFSHLVSRRLENSHLQNKIINHSQKPFMWNEQVQKNSQSQDSLQKDLIVNSKRLVGLKLPQIKKLQRKNQNIVKIKLNNLKVVDVRERIKTMKYSPQKMETKETRSSEKVIQGDRNSKIQKLIINQKYLFKQDYNKDKAQQKNKKSFFKIQKAKQIQQTQIQKIQIQQENQNKKNPQKIDETNIQQIQNKKSQQNILQIENYDKKMKIGKRKRKQEDRIKAMLLKTLQKTKAIQYVTQSGTAQRNHSMDRSLSNKKNSKQTVQQRSNIILLEEQSKQDKRFSENSLFKKQQIQKLKNSLKSGSGKQKQYSTHTQIKNKKLVQMVREVQNNKQHNLQTIKQQKTLINESSSDERLKTENHVKTESNIKEKIQNDNKIDKLEESQENQFLSDGGFQ